MVGRTKKTLFGPLVVCSGNQITRDAHKTAQHSGIEMYKNNTHCNVTLPIYIAWETCNICYLIPWPGPHATFSIHKLELPGPMEMQSSPVAILELRTVTPEDIWMWIPSVFGLFPEAETLVPCNITFLQPTIAMWNFWLFTELTPFITTLFEL